MQVRSAIEWSRKSPPTSPGRGVLSPCPQPLPLRWGPRIPAKPVADQRSNGQISSVQSIELVPPSGSCDSALREGTKVV
jgi:hypothetical protein